MIREYVGRVDGVPSSHPLITRIITRVSASPPGMLESMYREVASGLAGAVLWRGSGPAVGDTLRVLPDGCLDLIWSARDGLLIAGPDTMPHLVTRRPGDAYVGLRFPPGTGPAVFGVPADELRDRRVPLAALWPGALARELQERIAAAQRPGRVLESAALERLRHGSGPDPVAAAIVARLRSGAPVAATAAAVGLSERQLHRRCRVLFGYGPKTLARILRMQRALVLVRSGRPPARVAVDAGYADQAHLSREIRSLAGVALGALRR